MRSIFCFNLIFYRLIFYRHQTVLFFGRVLTVIALGILISACGSSGDDDEPPVNDPNLPSTPAELAATVLSSNQIELVWQASTDDGEVLGYEIYRDSVLLIDQLDANSYLDDMVEGDSEYVYTVLAVDDEGNKSQAASLTVTTPPVSTLPMINSNNYSELLSHVFDIYVGDIYNEPLLALGNFVIEGRNPDFSFIDVHNCETGGFSQTLDPAATVEGISFEFNFDVCFEEGVTYDGKLSGKHGYAESLVSEDGFSMQTHPELKVVYSGSSKFNNTMSRNDTLHQWSTTGMSVDSVSLDGKLQIGSATSAFGYGETGGGIYRSWLNGGFNVRSDQTEGGLLTVNTPVALTYVCDPNGGTPCSFELPHAWSFESGKLELVAEDGSTLLLDADTSTLETAKIVISSESGVETFLAEWSEWQPLLSFKRYQADSSEWISALDLANGEPDDRPAITADNYNDLLDHVFDILTGYNAQEALSVAEHFMDNNQPSETFRASGIRTDNFTCDNNGAVKTLRVDNDESIYPLDYRLRFDECEVDEFKFNGDLRGQEVRLNDGVLGLESRNLNWLDGSGIEYAFSGQSSDQRKGSGSDTVCSWDVERLGLYWQLEESVENVVTGSLHFEAAGSNTSDMTAKLSGNFQVTSEATGGFELGVSADLEITNSEGTLSENWAITKADLDIVAYDGTTRWSGDRSRLKYRAEDAVFEISNTAGSYTIDVPWTSWKPRAQAAVARLCSEL